MVWLLLALFAAVDFAISLDAYYEIEIVDPLDKCFKEPSISTEVAHDLGS